jgi:ATP-binding cassette subfamily B protein RaxB
MPVGTQLVMDHAIPANDRGLLMLICGVLMFFGVNIAHLSSLKIGQRQLKQMTE